MYKAKKQQNTNLCSRINSLYFSTGCTPLQLSKRVTKKARKDDYYYHYYYYYKCRFTASQFCVMTNSWVISLENICGYKQKTKEATHG